MSRRMTTRFLLDKVCLAMAIFCGVAVRGLCYASAYNHEYIHMYLPDEAVERDFRYTLDAKALGMIEGLPGKMALACYVNNHLVGVRSQIAYGDVVTMPVPKEFFVPGLNTVVFSNASNGADGKYNNWCNFDYYRLTVKGEQPGSVMMVR